MTVRQMDFLTLLTAGSDIADFRETLAPPSTVVEDPSQLAASLLAVLIFSPLRCFRICVASDVDVLRVLVDLDVDHPSTVTAFTVEIRARAAGL